MHEQQATNHPDLPGWSLGFQLDEMNGVSIVDDDGKRLLGFAPDEQNKIVSVTGGSWRVADRLP